MKSLTAQQPRNAQRIGLAVIALSALGMMNDAEAALTPFGTDISNTATVNYKVGGVDQSPINSNASSFKVDHKVDLTVIGNPVVQTPMTPGLTQAAVPFSVKNTGNGPDTFNLSGTYVSGLAVTNIKVYLDTGTSPGVWDAGDTLVSGSLAFTQDETKNFIIISDIPLSATNGQTAVVRLTATTTLTATSGADNQAGVDVVFADNGNNGTEFANNTYTISTANLSIVKSSQVISDGFAVAPNAKAIPGATVEYTMVILNGGTQPATGVNLSDAIPANTSYVMNSMTYAVNSGSPAALVDAADSDLGAYVSSGTPRILIGNQAGNASSPSVTVPAGESVTVKFRVTIN